MNQLVGKGVIDNLHWSLRASEISIDGNVTGLGSTVKTNGTKTISGGSSKSDLNGVCFFYVCKIFLPDSV